MKNMQTFEKLASLCTGYGGSYKPGQQNLQVDALIAMLNNAQQVLAEVREAETENNNAVNDRQLLFKRLRKLTSRIMNVIKASGANKLTVLDARSSYRKIWGIRSAAQPKVKEGETPPATATVSSNYSSMLDSFSKLVETVSTVAKYQPNEPELTLAALEQMVSDLQHAHTRVTQAEVQLAMVRGRRDELFYESESSMHATVSATKYYVRAVFGYQSSQTEEVFKLQFTKPKS